MAFLLFTGRLSAQDTVRVMQYNLLQYGNPSAYTGCNESNNGTADKDRCLRTILDFVRPDILTVNEFGSDPTLAAHFVNSNLNINGITCWKTDSLINLAQSDIVNRIFYNADKLTLQRHAAIITSLRDIDTYELYFNTPGLQAGDTVKVVCMVAHLKAGSGSENATKRFRMAQQAMDFMNEHYPGSNVLMMGDFNLYSSNEAAYLLLTRNYPNPDIRLMDPAGADGIGAWNNNADFAAFHTQSTNADNTVPCMANGGLDDRFDFILISDETAFGYHNVRYVENSYKALGNDGQHFNLSINEGGNSAVPQQVADALRENSDHLPVTIDLAVYAKIGIEENGVISDFHASISPNPCQETATLFFNHDKAGKVGFDILTLQGQVVSSETEHYESGSRQHELGVDLLPSGFYLVRLTGNDGQGQTVKLVVR